MKKLNNHHQSCRPQRNVTSNGIGSKWLFGLACASATTACISQPDDNATPDDIAADGASNSTASTQQQLRFGSTLPTDRATLHPRWPNPNPTFTSFGVYSRETTGGDSPTCEGVFQPSGTDIDLRDIGCALQPDDIASRRYFGSVTVNNPDNEALSYDWRLFVRPDNATTFTELYSGSGTTFDISPRGLIKPVTSDCYVAVTVIAPDPARNKTATVWFGRCTYNTKIPEFVDGPVLTIKPIPESPIPSDTPTLAAPILTAPTMTPPSLAVTPVL